MRAIHLFVTASACALALGACAQPRYPTELARAETPPVAAGRAPYTTPSPAGHVYARPPGAVTPSAPTAPPISTAPREVESQDLAPPPAAVASAPPPAARPASASVPVARREPLTPRPKLGPKPKIPVGERVTVRSGDTMYSFARRAGMSVDALADANDIKAPYRLKLGREIVLPAAPDAVARAKVELERWKSQARRLADWDREAKAMARSEPPPVVVADATPPRVRPAPIVEAPTRDYARPPSASTEPAAPRAPRRRWGKTEADAQVAVAAAAARAPQLAAMSAPAPSVQAGAADVAQAGRGRFIWPLHGSLLSGFGSKGGGLKNDGLDLAASLGSPVRAAAAGEVVYAGSAIPAFGNLVLVKHPGGWVTAYAHLDKIMVAMRQVVSQGQEIGAAGATGTVDQPQLHFEVRYTADPAEKAQPIDPALVLPGR